MPIPKILFQTWKTHDVPDWGTKWFRSWRDILEPQGWDCRLYSDKDNRDFIVEHYPWFLKRYDEYEFEIQRVDAVRPFLLYHFGGVYVDLDFECRKDLEPFLDNDLVLCKSSNSGTLTNCVMMSAPRHPFWNIVINGMIKAPKRQWYDVLKSLYIFRTTGPTLIHKSYATFQKRLEGLSHTERKDIEGKVTIVGDPKYFFPCTMFNKAKCDEPCDACFGVHHHKATWVGADHAIIAGSVFTLLVGIIVAIVLFQKKKSLKIN